MRGLPSTPNAMIVYLITNTVNGMKYVGQTKRASRKRWLEHLYDANSKCPSRQCIYLDHAIRKYGGKSFVMSSLEVCRDADHLNEREAWWINHLCALAPNGYNLRLGGKNSQMSETTRRRMSESKLKFHPGRGKPLHENTRAGYRNYLATVGVAGERNPMFGKTHTPETRRKISEAHKGKPKPWKAGPMHPNLVSALKIARAKQTGKNNPMFGRRHSEESKRKISANRRPFVLTPEISAIKSEAMKRVWESKRKEANAVPVAP